MPVDIGSHWGRYSVLFRKSGTTSRNIRRRAFPLDCIILLYDARYKHYLHR